MSILITLLIAVGMVYAPRFTFLTFVWFMFGWEWSLLTLVFLILFSIILSFFEKKA